MTTRIFLHGLDSSGSGTKGTFFSSRFPDMLRPDFDGSLQERMVRLDSIVSGRSELIIAGSSFGGLMAACLSINQPERLRRLILLAPALNFHEYQIPDQKVHVETILIIGKNDDVTPPRLVIPTAENTFSNLQITVADDDHLLHNTFGELDWNSLLN